MRILSLKVVMESLLKKNFEVLDLTQFLIFLKKNKNIGCRFLIATLQPLGLAFFNSISKLLTS